MKWSEEAWKAAEPIYEDILRQPFVKELAAGELARDKFLFYLCQDALYLTEYTKVLAHVASRLHRKEHVADFLKFATDGIAVEQALHESFIKGMTLPAMSPTCLMYTAIEKSKAYEPVAVEAASLLPCFWIYQKVGDYILASARNLDENPYAAWIRTYGDEAFAAATRRAIEICDELAEAADIKTCRHMTEVFVICAKMEWMFWDSAYNFEKWKI